MQQPVRPEKPARDRFRWKRWIGVAALLIAVYGLAAYVVLPAAWSRHEQQPGLAARPMLTRTVQGIPGDPLNVGLVGTHEDVTRAFHAAGWYAVDAITWRSSLKIVGSVLLDRPYRAAPVSPLDYDGRRQDLAFEKPEGVSPDRRHHVRLWRVLENGAEGRTVWLGAATFDRGVGVSHYTGAVTHHIAPDIDVERAQLIGDLVAAGMVEARYQIAGIGPTLNGRNGEGDRYWTDGEIFVARLVADGQRRSEPPLVIAPPALIRMKDALWRGLIAR
jgi:hypothetical protein